MLLQDQIAFTQPQIWTQADEARVLGLTASPHRQLQDAAKIHIKCLR